MMTRAGWYIHHQSGSHIHFRHEDKPNETMIVPYHAGREIPTGLAHKLLKQAGMK
jgi:predicted RNA binding protein YcfA (HicA-like mRNA interferase family)